MITKIGTDFTKEALNLGGFTQGFNNFKGNFPGAIKSIRKNFRPAMTNMGTQIGSTLTTGRQALGAMSPEQKQALSFGAKGLGALGTAGVIGYGIHAGNKDYNDRKRYQVNPNIPSNDIAGQGN